MLEKHIKKRLRLSLKESMNQSYVIILFKSQKNAEKMNSRVSRNNDRRKMILLKSVVCNIKNSRSIIGQEKIVLLSKLGIKTPLSKILLLRDVLL